MVEMNHICHHNNQFIKCDDIGGDSTVDNIMDGVRNLHLAIDFIERKLIDYRTFHDKVIQHIGILR